MHVINFILHNGFSNCVSEYCQSIPFLQCEKFHSTIKAKLPEEINKKQLEGGFDPKKTTQYCEEMRKLLQMKLESEEKQHLREEWRSEAAAVVKFLRGTNIIASL